MSDFGEPSDEDTVCWHPKCEKPSGGTKFCSKQCLEDYEPSEDPRYDHI